MPSFSKASEDKLKTCHPDLQIILRTVIQDFDFSVIFGHRTKEEQDALFAQGRDMPGKIVTNKRFPDSKHNAMPSLAVDVAPYPIDWDDENRFHELAGRILEAAALMAIVVIWGGNWKSPHDLGHFELAKGG